jgi:hypothetical protein
VVTLFTDVQAEVDAASVVHRHPPPRIGTVAPAAGLGVGLPQHGVAMFLSAVRRRHPSWRQHPLDHSYDRGRKSYGAGRPRVPAGGDQEVVRGTAELSAGRPGSRTREQLRSAAGKGAKDRAQARLGDPTREPSWKSAWNQAVRSVRSL